MKKIAEITWYILLFPFAFLIAVPVFCFALYFHISPEDLKSARLRFEEMVKEI